MAISTKTFATMVTDQVTAIQAKSARLIDFTIGSVLRALVETNAALGLWLQGVILQLLSLTRAATSAGADLDSWVADFGITRLAATYSTGSETFSRFTSTNQALVPIGAQVQTTDGTQKYTVTVDVTNAAYNAGLGGYVIAAGISSVTVPVTASTAGAAGNAGASQVTVLSQPITYVDTVTNALAFTGGANAETDVALRTRFIAFIASLSKATVGAIGNAIVSAELGAVYTITENKHYDGTTDSGYFTVVVDDGSGAPSTAYLNAVGSAIDAVRAVTTRFGVFGPTIVNVTAALTVTLAAGYDPTATRLVVANALKAYINALALGQTLTYTRLVQVAYDSSPAVVNVTAVLLNGGTADVTVSPQQVLKWSAVTVS